MMSDERAESEPERLANEDRAPAEGEAEDAAAAAAERTSDEAPVDVAAPDANETEGEARDVDDNDPPSPNDETVCRLYFAFFETKPLPPLRESLPISHG